MIIFIGKVVDVDRLLKHKVKVVYIEKPKIICEGKEDKMERLCFPWIEE